MAVTARPRSHMTQAEAQTRIDLAACYRLVDLFGWSDLINTRITARVPGPQNHFLINRFGMLYDEITASSLVKIGCWTWRPICAARCICDRGKVGGPTNPDSHRRDVHDAH